MAELVARMIRVVNKHGAVNFSGLTAELMINNRPDTQPSNDVKFLSLARDNAICKTCLLPDEIKNPEKRKILALYESVRGIRKGYGTSNIMVNLASAGIVFLHAGYYKLTKRGVYVAKCLKGQYQ